MMLVYRDKNENEYVLLTKRGFMHLALAVLVAAATFLVPFWKTTRTSEWVRTDVWENLPSYLCSLPAVWQQQVWHDGRMAEGPLLDGRRHGEWHLSGGGQVVHVRMGCGVRQSSLPTAVDFDFSDLMP